MFAIYAVIAIHNEWKYNTSFDAEEYRALSIDVLKFLLSGLVRKGADGLYYLSDVKDGNETGVMASVDTSTTLKFAEGFLAVGEMYGMPEYTEIGESMLATLEGNRREDGMILACRNSPYLSSVTEYYRRFYKPLRLDISQLEKIKDAVRTPFGYDSQVGTEEKLHWPWYDSWAMRAYTVAKMPGAVSEHMAHCLFGRSSLGALPEFIRMDRVGIGYYYTTPHGSLVTALAEAAAVVDADKTLLLGYGLSDKYKTLHARGICVEGGLRVSLDIEDGTLTYLEIENLTGNDVSIKAELNPEIKCVFPLSTLTVRANSSSIPVATR
jgi:hypothetical protein